MAFDHWFIFCWVNRTGHLLYNPAERLAFPRPEQSLPHVLNESEIARLIESPCITTAIGLRDRALLETLYATGIRHVEAHRLDLYDIDTCRATFDRSSWQEASAIAWCRSRKPPRIG